MTVEWRDSHRPPLEGVDGITAGHRAWSKSHVGQLLLVDPGVVVALEVLFELSVVLEFEPAHGAVDHAFFRLTAVDRAVGGALWRFSGGAGPEVLGAASDVLRQ